MWKIVEMCGREIAIRPILPSDTYVLGQQLTKCGDCGQPTKYIVQELLADGEPRKEQPFVWGHCGVCEVGG